MKTVVKLPNTKEKAFIEVLNDDCPIASIWGTVEKVEVLRSGKWHITIENDSTLSFLYVDAIAIRSEYRQTNKGGK